MKTIAVGNFKGGVGKTTIAASVGVDLALRHGKKILLVDFDPQCNLTEAFINDYEDDNYSNIMDVIKGEKELQTYPIGETLDLLIGSIYIEQFSNIITNDPKLKLSPGTILKRILQKLSGEYDICIIDTRPAIDLTVSNALIASDYVLIPVQPTARSLKGLETTTTLISDIKEDLNPGLVLLGFVLNEYIDKNVSSGFINAQLDEVSNFIFKTKIRKAEAVLFAENRGINIFEQKKNSLIKQDFQDLTDEILKMIQL